MSFTQFNDRPDKQVISLHTASARGPIRRQQLFFILMAMSNQLSSASHMCSKFSSIATEGAISNMSSAYKIIHIRLTPGLMLARSFIYKLNNIGDRNELWRTPDVIANILKYCNASRGKNRLIFLCNVVNRNGLGGSPGHWSSDERWKMQNCEMTDHSAFSILSISHFCMVSVSTSAHRFSDFCRVETGRVEYI